MNHVVATEVAVRRVWFGVGDIGRNGSMYFSNLVFWRMFRVYTFWFNCVTRWSLFKQQKTKCEHVVIGTNDKKIQTQWRGESGRVVHSGFGLGEKWWLIFWLLLLSLTR